MAEELAKIGLKTECVQSSVDCALGIAFATKRPDCSRYYSCGERSHLLFNGSAYAGAWPHEPGSPPAQLTAIRQQLESSSVEALYQLDAEFAMVSVSCARRQLILARDHFGTKPLYFRVLDSGAVAFSSTVRALEALAPANLNKLALASFLASYAPPVGQTYFEGICSVPAASSVAFNLGEEPKTVRHWRPKPNPKWWAQNKHAPIEAIRSELVRAVLSRVDPSNPTALTVSGGLDSSVIACIACTTQKHLSFVGFSDVLPDGYFGPAHDERKYVQILLDHLPNLRGMFFSAAGSDVLEAGALSYERWRIPTNNFQGYFFQQLGSEARSYGGRIVLGGYGGDHCISGDAQGYAAELLLKGRGIDAAREILRLRSRDATSIIAALKTHLIAPMIPNGVMQMRARSMRSDYISASALREGFRELLRAVNNDWQRPGPWFRSLNQRAILGLEMVYHTGGLSGFITFAPWYDLEYRCPFYDWRLIEAVLSIPSSFKVVSGTERALIRAAAQPYVPAVLLHRHDKGPGSPLFMTKLRKEKDRIRSEFHSFRRNATFDELVDPAKVEQSLSELDGDGDWQTTSSVMDRIMQPYFLGKFLVMSSSA